MQPINRTTTLLAKSGRKRTIEVAVKRKYFPDHDTGELRAIETTPQIAKWHRGYKFEVMQHDLLLGFAPSERSLPFMRITDPKTRGSWALWLKGFGDNISTRGIAPVLYDKFNSGMHWALDSNTDLRLDILGHRIRKTITLYKRPDWNSITFIIARGGASLIDGLAVGKPERTLMAFRKGANLGFNNLLFWFEKPTAHDSSGDGLSILPKHLKVDYTMKPIRTGVYELRIDLDPAELDAAKYPVYIDPTITLQPDATEGYDNAMRTNAQQANNQGALDYMMLSYYPSVNPTGYWRPIIKFTGADILFGTTIISATLSLWVRADWYVGGNAPGTIHQVRNGRDWGEGTKANDTATDGECSAICYAYPLEWTALAADDETNDIKPSVDPGIPLAAGTDIWKNIDVAASMQAIADDGYNYGWMLKRINDNGSYTYTNETLASSDYATADYWPKLTVEYEEGGIIANLGALAGSGIIRPFATGIL